MGLTFGMLMETVLLIIRTNRPDVSVDEKYAHLLDPKIWDAKGDLKQKAAAAAAAQRSGGSATAEPRRPPPPKPQESKKQK